MPDFRDSITAREVSEGMVTEITVFGTAAELNGHTAPLWLD